MIYLRFKYIIQGYMYIRLLLRLLLGYVRIEVEGYYVERFINICTNRKILIWNLKRQKGVKLYLNIGIRDFKNLSKIARKTNCKVKILKKRGIPFFLNRYKKRKIFAIFLIVILCAICVSSKYVWNIEILVEDNLTIDNIEEDLESVGITKGILKSNINTEQVIQELRLKRNDIAWVGIDIEGTNVIINIVKADNSPEIINNSDYCNIVASKSGIITKITAQNGTALVGVGDTVQKGDILIAGYMEGKYTDLRYVHSLGEIEAKVWYEKTEEVKFNEEIYRETGVTENKYEISFNSYKIKLYKNLSKFELYETKVEENNLKIWKDFYLPISINKITNKEQIKENKTYTLEEATNKGVEELSNQIENEIQDKEKITGKNVRTVENEYSVIVTVTYEVIESIGENQKIE